MDNIYAERSAKYPGYGVKSNKNRLSREDSDKVCLSTFDEADPLQHIMKVLFGFGIYCGPRGRMEHTKMRVSHIQTGTFEKGHKYEGKTFMGIRSMIDKKNHLTLHNLYTRDVEELMRMPVLNDDPTSNDFAGSLLRYLGKLHGSQDRLY